LLAVSFALVASAQAQTIADYSNVQRAVLAAEMARTADPMAGIKAAPAPAAPASAPPVAPPPQMHAPVPLSPVEPRIDVAGVVQTSKKVLAEVSVGGVAHLLEAGQSVPGTPWAVQSVEVGRVVLAKRVMPTARPGRKVIAKAPTTRVFTLAKL